MVTGVAMEVTISAATTTAGAGLVGDVAGSTSMLTLVTGLHYEILVCLTRSLKIHWRSLIGPGFGNAWLPKVILTVGLTVGHSHALPMAVLQHYPIATWLTM